MQNHRKDIIHFLTWMRNGIAYATTWFLILILLYNKLHNNQAISTDSLIKIVLWIMGSVFLFNLLFTRIIIKRWNFLLRLSVFMLSISLYELLGFYWLGVFPNNISPINWFFFFLIIFVLYFICIAIYHRYSKKQGEIYTHALQQYQRKRSMENEK